MPPKRKTNIKSNSLNSEANIASGKKIQKKIVTPTKTQTAKKSIVSSRTPSRRCTTKIYKKEDIVIAVMNVENARAKQFKTTKEALLYLKEMQNDFGAEQSSKFKHEIFQDHQAFEDACKDYKEANLTTMMHSQGSQKEVRFDTKPANQSPLVSIKPAAKDQKKYQRSNLPSTNITADTKFTCFENLPAGLSVSSPAIQSTEANSSANKFQLTLFPQQVSVSTNEAITVFTIDFIESNTSKTIWTHKPSAWEQVFKADKALPEDQQNADIFFHNLRSALRRSEPKGTNQKSHYDK